MRISSLIRLIDPGLTAATCITALMLAFCFSEAILGEENGTEKHSADSDPWNQASFVDLGPQDGFYRRTQLQGHLVQDGLYLFEVPGWWTEGSDFPYLKKDSGKEVFFVDKISITRFLGGYTQDWKHKGRQLPSNDLAYVDENDEVHYRLELVGKRLRPYLENGYRDFIINIENIPWDLSRTPDQAGPYGNTSPPRDWEEWEAFILAVCQELRRVLPPESIETLGFKIGNEYNQKKSFSGDHEDFLKLYDYSASAIREVFPNAEIMPGEIGGGARHPDNAVDYPNLFQHFVDGRNRAGDPEPAPVAVLARSSHSFPDVSDISPRERVRRSVSSMRQVLRGKPESFRENLRMEHHQFGVLGAPGQPRAVQTGVRAASWQFQTIFRLKAAGYLDNVWAWLKSEQIDFPRGGETHLLTGIGWLYSVLDHLRGSQMFLLVSDQPENSERDVTAVGFAGAERFTVIAASWSPSSDDSNQPEQVTITIPENALAFTLVESTAGSMRLDVEDNPFEAIRDDLKESGLLKEQYLNPTQPAAMLRDMATDLVAGRRMVRTHLDEVIAIQQKSLCLKTLPEVGVHISQRDRGENRRIEIDMLPDDLIVIQFPKPRALEKMVDQ